MCAKPLFLATFNKFVDVDTTYNYTASHHLLPVQDISQNASS